MKKYLLAILTLAAATIDCQKSEQLIDTSMIGVSQPQPDTLRALIVLSEFPTDSTMTTLLCVNGYMTKVKQDSLTETWRYLASNKKPISGRFQVWSYRIVQN